MSDRSIRRISILGVGLIGGSLGLCWKKYRPSLRIVGYDRDEVLQRAVERGAIDEAEGRLEAAVAGADLVVLSVRLSGMPSLLEEISPILDDGCIVTDVGSVKSPIARHARDVLPAGVSFVGGHPMAGSEHGGIDHADPFMFENATYVICPAHDADHDSFRHEHKELLDLVSATGANILLLDPERHDRIAASVSHLPQLLAVALVEFVASMNQDDDAFLRLAAGGFRDMTRIASSPFTLWRDILAANEGQVLDATSGFASSFQRIRNRLIEGSFEELEMIFDRARTIRETIPRNTKGFLHPLADVYVYAEDRPGVLLSITQTLFEVDLNIKDIELLKIREGSGGAFRMSFDDDKTADSAVSALTSAGFSAHRL